MKGIYSRKGAGQRTVKEAGQRRTEGKKEAGLKGVGRRKIEKT